MKMPQNFLASKYDIKQHSDATQKQFESFITFLLNSLSQLLKILVSEYIFVLVEFKHKNFLLLTEVIC